MKKGKIKLTLSVNKIILDEYKKYCENEGLIISKQIENFMRKALERK